ncbi:MAG TPA: beta-1,4-xylanase [Deltaproteobacteria bacterium]|nr:beta-1,4-xylanase [Deltaproteobacteria bacterium]
MRHSILLWLGIAGILLAARTGYGRHAAIPDGIIPQSVGVNIHFIQPVPEEMKLLVESGVRWVRMDLVWDVVEHEKGHYDFSSYDHFVSELDKYGLKWLAILDYNNPLYDQNLSPHTEEARQAFARFAVAGARRYAGKGYLWEMWNEPNNRGFWKPRPKAEDYILLAQAVGEAFQKAGLAKEALVGPATARFPFGFLKKCFEKGLLSDWSAVTVHPYRGRRIPESAAKDYRLLRKILQKYAPKDREIPILSGEWGYSSVQFGLNEEKQAKYLPRMWLANLAADIPLSIWYDWKDDGPDPREKEHHFGMVYADLKPKATYVAAQTLTRTLDGFRFEKRLSLGSTRDYVLQFRKGSEVRYAAWTSSRQKSLNLPEQGNWQVLDYLGRSLGKSKSKAEGLRITLTDSPKYFVPQ